MGKHGQISAIRHHVKDGTLAPQDAVENLYTLFCRHGEERININRKLMEEERSAEPNRLKKLDSMMVKSMTTIHDINNGTIRHSGARETIKGE